jgi:hypothetical protein
MLRHSTIVKQRTYIIPANGPRNTVYPFMKFRNPVALARISHGAKAHPPMIAQMTCPRRILIYFGMRAAISFPAERELAEMLVPSVARTKAKDAKNAAARLSQ